MKIWERALRGEFQYVQFLADRIMGKVKDSISIEGEMPEDRELVIRVVHVDDDDNELPNQKQYILPAGTPDSERRIK